MSFKTLNETSTSTFWGKVKSYVNTRLAALGSVATEDVVPINKGGHGGVTAEEARTNLGITYGTEVPTTAPSTGDGSVYFFTDELTPVAVTEGGTGATDGATAMTNLGVADYVVEQGTSDIWTYRKWNSGIAECWTTAEQATTGSATAASMGGYYTYKNISLPFSFVSVDNIMVNGRTGTGVGFGVGFLINSTTITVGAVGNQNTTTMKYKCIVYGRWK